MCYLYKVYYNKPHHLIGWYSNFCFSLLSIWLADTLTVMVFITHLNFLFINFMSGVLLKPLKKLANTKTDNMLYGSFMIRQVNIIMIHNSIIMYNFCIVIYNSIMIYNTIKIYNSVMIYNSLWIQFFLASECDCFTLSSGFRSTYTKLLAFLKIIYYHKCFPCLEIYTLYPTWKSNGLAMVRGEKCPNYPPLTLQWCSYHLKGCFLNWS